MGGITLENLILVRLNDVHNAMLNGNYGLALNALQIVWALIPDESIREEIDSKMKAYQDEWKQKSDALVRMFNEREYDDKMRDMRMSQELQDHTLNMISNMVEYTTRLLIDNNLIAREPSAP